MSRYSSIDIDAMPVDSREAEHDAQNERQSDSDETSCRYAVIISATASEEGKYGKSAACTGGDSDPVTSMAS